MKGCDDYGATIQLYLDRELSCQGLEDFRAHLGECAACRTELEAEEKLSALLRRSRPLYSAPDALRARVMTTLELSPSIASRTNASNRVAFAAAILIVAVSLFLIPAFLKQSNAASYIETAIAAHLGVLNGSLPLEIQSESPSVITGWFTGKVPFTFRLPNSADDMEHQKVYRLTGGRLVDYKGGYVALIAYQMRQEKISLLVSSSRSAVAAGGEEIASGGLIFHYSRKATFNIITWSNHGLTYALVSSFAGSGRLSCMVCHQDMPTGDRFSVHH
jgi:mycothiol system anti-sigma-R factor